MFIATNRIRVQKGRGQELEERFRHRRGVDEQPGFDSFELWRAAAEGENEEYLVVTRWESAEAHRAWTQSEAFRQAHAGPRAEFIVGPTEPKGYAVCISSMVESVAHG